MQSNNNEVKTFTFKTDTEIEIRTITKDGKPWFFAKDVSDALGYVNSRGAVQKHCKYPELLKRTETVLLDFPARGMTIIPESDMYRLIINSKLSSAEKFEQWVMEKVLPTISKTGAFMTGEKLHKVLSTPMGLATILQEMIDLHGQADALTTTLEEEQTVNGFLAFHVEVYAPHGIKTKMGKKASARCRPSFPVSVKTADLPHHGGWPLQGSGKRLLPGTIGQSGHRSGTKSVQSGLIVLVTVPCG